MQGQARAFSLHLLEGMHCSLVEPSSLGRVIMWIARRSRGSRVVSVTGWSVKVHVDRGWW